MDLGSVAWLGTMSWMVADGALLARAEHRLVQIGLGGYIQRTGALAELMPCGSSNPDWSSAEVSSFRPRFGGPWAWLSGMP